MDKNTAESLLCCTPSCSRTHRYIRDSHGGHYRAFIRMLGEWTLIRGMLKPNWGICMMDLNVCESYRNDWKWGNRHINVYAIWSQAVAHMLSGPCMRVCTCRAFNLNVFNSVQAKPYEQLQSHLNHNHVAFRLYMKIDSQTSRYSCRQCSVYCLFQHLVRIMPVKFLNFSRLVRHKITILLARKMSCSSFLPWLVHFYL